MPDSNSNAPRIEHDGPFRKGELAITRPWTTDQHDLNALFTFQFCRVSEEFKFQQGWAVFRIRRVIVNDYAAAMALQCLGNVQPGRFLHDVRAVSPVPVAVGFGVSKPAHVRAIARAGADGVIVASALVDALGPDGRDVAALGRLVGSLRAATAQRLEVTA